MQRRDWPALQQQAEEALRKCMTAQPAVPSLDGIQEARRDAEEAPRWFDAQPARRLLAYLPPMVAAERAAPRDAAAALLAALAEENCASLLVLHAVMPTERLASYAQRHEGSIGWGLASDPSEADCAQKRTRLTVMPDAGEAGRMRLNLGRRTTPEEALRGAAEWLADFWVARLKSGRLDGLDRPTGLPSGAVLGVLEADAARLWPDLFREAESRPKEAEKAAPEIQAKRRPGERTPCLPDDENLAAELAAERARQPHGATARLAKKYGCNRSTIQRRAGAGDAARRLKPPTFPRLASAKR